jgi:HPt (histidine-containing phosphotransfer) domain-containing protein
MEDDGVARGAGSARSVAAAERLAGEALRAIWIRNREEILAAVATVDDAVENGLAGRPDDGRRELAVRAAHRLAGSSGTFGFPLAGEIAGRLEVSLSGSGSPSAEEYRGMADLVLILGRELAE